MNDAKASGSGSSASQQAIWDHFQTPGSAGCFQDAQPRYRYLARKVRGHKRVLNIGVGAGGLEALLESSSPGVIHSLDPSQVAIEALRERLGVGERAVLGSMTCLPYPDHSFTAVVVSEVFEHLAPDEACAGLAEIARVLSPTGQLVGTVPANERLSDNQVICPCCGKTFHRWGHLQSYSPQSLREFLTLKFTDVHVGYRAFPDWTRSGLAAQVKSVVREALGRFGAHIAQPNLVFSARRPGR